MPRIEPLREFHASSHGSQIILESRGRTARRVSKEPLEPPLHLSNNPLGPGCVVFGKQQLGNFAEGRFAEIVVEYDGSRASRSVHQGGGVLFGITKTRPGPHMCIEKLPKTIQAEQDGDLLKGVYRSATQVPDSWIIDVYGSLWRRPSLPKDIEKGDGETLGMADPTCGPDADFLEVGVARKTELSVEGWDAYAKLSDKDRIGLLVRPNAELKLYLNGKNVANLQLNTEEIRVTDELYLVVEVLGRCLAVSISDKAKAPEVPPPEE